jgi:hypothetical protein
MALAAVVSVVGAQGQDGERARPEDTEVRQPVPPVVDPGPAPAPVPPPSDAIVLFDGTGLDQWVNVRDGGPAGWTVHDGVMTVQKSTGSIETRRRFRNYQLHLEWRVPEGTTGSGQARGNSGVFLASPGGEDAGYELQILDSYRNETYVNGITGSVYKQSPPLANPTRAPGAWQTYDVVWTAPVFDESGTVRAPARVTALFNGELVQRDFTLAGETVFIGAPQYRAHGHAPIKLQAHGDPSPPISFRNIWVRHRLPPDHHRLARRRLLLLGIFRACQDCPCAAVSGRDGARSCDSGGCRRHARQRAAVEQHHQPRRGAAQRATQRAAAESCRLGRCDR